MIEFQCKSQLINEIIVFCFGTGSVYATLIIAVRIITNSSPLQQLVLLIALSLTSVALITVFVKIYYLAITFVIIYIGAIMILFLFTIMMFNFTKKTSINRNWFFAQLSNKISKTFHLSILSFILIKIYFWIKWNLNNILYNNLYFTKFNLFQYNNIKLDINYYYKDIYIFSELLYSKYGIMLIILSILMLIAMFGSLSLILKTQSKKNYEKI